MFWCCHGEWAHVQSLTRITLSGHLTVVLFDRISKAWHN